jgi:hypothetical protein
LHSTINPDWKYYDFKKNPELVSEVLEDFKPWAHYDSVQLFYEMLRWVNGPESKFETSDCGFRGPGENQQKDGWPKEMVCSGGLFVFFRNLQYNLSDESKSWKENHPGGSSLAKPYAQSKYTQWIPSLEFANSICLSHTKNRPTVFETRSCGFHYCTSGNA